MPSLVCCWIIVTPGSVRFCTGPSSITDFAGVGGGGGGGKGDDDLKDDEDSSPMCCFGCLLCPFSALSLAASFASLKAGVCAYSRVSSSHFACERGNILANARPIISARGTAPYVRESEEFDRLSP
eukprot:CAMPEP_0185260448 /NCGR_PEP_ID=MMETSP1359-20130426/9040_1 /TAXON_ID=552665 /ORGANISM="Bigelowiella longifila, Strain CCMP242" /LENGTH=125 /DNA_ID=CAMNT_0027846713 /DNA_START=361 /DNA_END=738 /DNA_ORIENTATION=-